MTRDEVVALFERRHEALNHADAAALAAFHAEDGIVESPFGGGRAQGREAIQRIYQAFFEAFPRARFRQEALLVEGDRAVVLVHVEGAHRGELMGLAPSERSFSLSIATVHDLRDGLIAHERRVYDFTGLLVQVGALKAKPI
jgi:steroid delta-isomerase-like uncharacterized protein